MSNKTRRALARANGTLGRKQLAADVCRMCAFVATEIIGARDQDFTLQDGTLVELGINKRLEPPLGIRFPRSAAKRSICLVCTGRGRVECPTCHGTGHDLVNTGCASCQGNGKVACEKCAGFGYNWSRDDFAPTCPLCSQFIMAWLQERERAAMLKQGSAAAQGKIILPSGRRPGPTTQGIILPGRG